MGVPTGFSSQWRGEHTPVVGSRFDSAATILWRVVVVALSLCFVSFVVWLVFCRCVPLLFPVSCPLSLYEGGAFELTCPVAVWGFLRGNPGPRPNNRGHAFFRRACYRRLFSLLFELLVRKGLTVRVRGGMDCLPPFDGTFFPLRPFTGLSLEELVILSAVRVATS